MRQCGTEFFLSCCAPHSRLPGFSSITPAQWMGMWSPTAVAAVSGNLWATCTNAVLPVSPRARDLVSPSCRHSDSPFSLYTAYASKVHLQTSTTEWDNAYFIIGNKMYIRKLNPLFPMVMNLAFKTCISQCLFECPLMLTRGNTLKALRTSMVSLYAELNSVFCIVRKPHWSWDPTNK